VDPRVSCDEAVLEGGLFACVAIQARYPRAEELGDLLLLATAGIHLVVAHVEQLVSMLR